ncbi:uncharacterized protein LOC142660960 isoform X2 [Rhinoderma darwinii]|uniref:uncharacterized protein LOC142660960 isoform X2 n=1 Tax=Rhinoderma darwinii TaxID=43563 RepID=UPI003F67D395
MLYTWFLLAVILQVSSASPEKQYNGLAHNRTLRNQECNEDEYLHRGICCITCPEGKRVSVHCTVNHARGECEDCTLGKDFTAGPNGMETCLACLVCKDDQVLMRNCTPKLNAICQCKPGYYCSPDEPCEICNRCSRCGEGQRIKQLCTSTTDTVCEDVSAPEPTSTKANLKNGQTVPMLNESPDDVNGLKEVPNDSEGSKEDKYLWLFIVLAVVLVIIIIIVGYVIWKRKGKDNKNNSETTSLDSVRTEGNPPEEKEPCLERRRLITPEVPKCEKQNNQMVVAYVPGAQSQPGGDQVAEPVGGDVDEEESAQLGAHCKICSEPQPCDQQWTGFFYIVIDSIHPDNILQLVRKLHLKKTVIDQILRDNPNNCKEQSYNLLEQWRQQKGKQTSMTAVLKELNIMALGGCCENIVNRLKAEKIPMN